MKEEAFVYMLRCSGGTLYTGWTNDLERRLAAHNAGKGARYTRGRRPVELEYYESFPDKESAMSREWELKQWTRQKKEALIAEFGPGKQAERYKEEEA